MKKRVLALHYSQTGQLSGVLASFLRGLDPEHFEVETVCLRPREPYPFPWSFGDFIDTFPETVLGIVPELEPTGIDPDASYDLVVLAYTVWYLAPAPPIQAFLASDEARVLAGKPVVTLIACRNMWHQASEQVKTRLAELGAHHQDHVAVVDQGPAWATFVTTPRWMFTGKKDAFWKFPPAGVSEEEVAAVERFGRALTEQRDRIGETPVRPLLTGLGAVRIDRKFVIPELMGRTLFAPWSRITRWAGPPGGLLRAFLLRVFTTNLLLVVLILIPLSIVVRLLLYPFLRAPLRAYTARLMAPSGE